MPARNAREHARIGVLSAVRRANEMCGFARYVRSHAAAVQARPALMRRRREGHYADLAAFLTNCLTSE